MARLDGEIISVTDQLVNLVSLKNPQNTSFGSLFHPGRSVRIVTFS